MSIFSSVFLSLDMEARQCSTVLADIDVHFMSIFRHGSSPVEFQQRKIVLDNDGGCPPNPCLALAPVVCDHHIAHVCDYDSEACTLLVFSANFIGYDKR